ncbi:MAG: hypothetical protein ABSF03_28695, partial [Streptosporangiaceae bacterium]
GGPGGDLPGVALENVTGARLYGRRYGVTMGHGARLQPGSFLTKGEKVPPREHWGGILAWPL